MHKVLCSAGTAAILSVLALSGQHILYLRHRQPEPSPHLISRHYSEQRHLLSITEMRHLVASATCGCASTEEKDICKGIEVPCSQCKDDRSQAGVGAKCEAIVGKHYTGNKVTRCTYSGPKKCEDDGTIPCWYDKTCKPGDIIEDIRCREGSCSDSSGGSYCTICQVLNATVKPEQEEKCI